MSDTLRKWGFGLLPLVLLGGVIVAFVTLDPMSFMEDTSPPVEELTIDRVTFPEQGTVRLHVVNGGPEPVTVAQVMVDEAYWEHSIDGPRTIDRLGSRTITLPYAWVQGEPHEFTLVTSTGVTFTREVEVAAPTPAVNARFLGTFALLGIYAGVVPVLIGLLWFPFLGRIRDRWIHFFLSFTVGLLLFLAVDGFQESLEIAGRVPEAFQGIGLVALGVLGAVLLIRGVADPLIDRFQEGATLPASGVEGPEPGDGPAAPSGLALAYLIALGIGLHNMGEGLAIGAAFAAGELALGSFLVIGFALHNTTEGLGIVAPVARERPSLWHFVGMGLLAGIPTILGTWIGGFSYSPAWITFFLALGVGAILEVSWRIGAVVARGSDRGLLSPLNAAGLGLGLVVMFATAMLTVV
jgi:zinc transporter ZupT